MLLGVCSGIGDGDGGGGGGGFVAEPRETTAGQQARRKLTRVVTHAPTRTSGLRCLDRRSVGPRVCVMCVSA